MRLDPLTAWHGHTTGHDQLLARIATREHSPDELLPHLLDARGPIRSTARVRRRDSAVDRRVRRDCHHAAIGRRALRQLLRLGSLSVLCLGLITVGSDPAGAASNQVSGVGVFDLSGGVCPSPPAGYTEYTSYPPIVLSGDLEGCWYTRIDTVKDNGAPSGVYLETGREVFVGRLDDGPVGLFATTYRFESKWDPDVSTGSEVVGRCQHPIVAGSGTGGFAGVTGRINFKDVVADGSYEYRGHIDIP
jgi:hypothetical protein